MRKERSYIIIASVLIAGLTTFAGCGKADEQPEKEGSVSAVSDVLSKEGEKGTEVKEGDKEGISKLLSSLGAVVLPEFKDVSDLDIDEAIEIAMLIDMKSPDGVFSRFGFANSESSSDLQEADGREIDKSEEFVREILRQYYNESDMNSFKIADPMSDAQGASEIENRIQHVHSFPVGSVEKLRETLKLDDKDQMIRMMEDVDKEGLEKEGHLEVKGVKLEDGEYIVEADLRLNDKDLEKREYVMGKHEDGSFYFKSMEVVEKYGK